MLCNSYILHKTKWTGRAHTPPPAAQQGFKEQIMMALDRVAVAATAVSFLGLHLLVSCDPCCFLFPGAPPS